MCSALFFIGLIVINFLKIDYIIIGVLREMTTIPTMFVSIILVPLFLIKHHQAQGAVSCYYWTGLICSIVVLGFIVVSFLG